MAKRPYLGRVGAGALIAVAALALAGALGDSSTASFHAQIDPDRVNGNVSLITTRGPVPSLVDQARPMVPIGRTTIQVPILMYHYIRNNPVAGDQLGFNLSVTPADFKRQMDWLEANGYHPVDFDDMRAYFLGQNPLPAKPVILTFDDGYKDLYTTAYPVLRAHHFKAVAYLVSGFLGAPHNVSREDVVEMDANGIQIGAHTVSHVDLTKTPNAEMTRQLVDSKADLEQLVKHPVVDFCYPAGRYDGRVVVAVQAAGYQTATTTYAGTEHSLADRFTWSRVRVGGGESLDRFAADLNRHEGTVLIKARPTPPRVPTNPRLELVYPLELPRVVFQAAAEQRPLP